MARGEWLLLPTMEKSHFLEEIVVFQCRDLAGPGGCRNEDSWDILGFSSSGSGACSVSTNGLIRSVWTESIYPALNSTIQTNVMSIFISCYPPFYLISIEQDLFIPSSAPAWIFISNSDSRLSSRRPNSGSGSAGMQPAKGRGFCTILVKMLHISVKINENKRAACSNRRHCCLVFPFFPGVCFKIHGKMWL